MKTEDFSQVISPSESLSVTWGTTLVPWGCQGWAKNQDTNKGFNGLKSHIFVCFRFLGVKTVSVSNHFHRKKKLVYAGNQLLQTFGMGAGWDLLVIQALKPCALRLEDQIMWCSTNKPMPDSHSVERYMASKENPTCNVDEMMSSNIEN